MVDVSSLLNDVLSALEFVPLEIQHLFQEIKDLDEKVYKIEKNILKSERNWESHLTIEANKAKRSDEETKIVKSMFKDFSEADILYQKKIELASKALLIIERHSKKLDFELRKANNFESGNLLKTATLGHARQSSDTLNLKTNGYKIDPGSLYKTPNSNLLKKYPSTTIAPSNTGIGSLGSSNNSSLNKAFTPTHSGDSGSILHALSAADSKVSEKSNKQNAGIKATSFPDSLIKAQSIDPSTVPRAQRLGLVTDLDRHRAHRPQTFQMGSTSQTINFTVFVDR
ncbi:Chromatin modification-related protein YNG2 [Smittium culicis]|uniref:Chromatin modification-related protein YNG2 n=1 Tax=Smittium culicis TaxID=133412 RepID=A0A1R1YTG4_9FUNG|nr:Chromatin modification-related protein YNG2 [Smittium culicis]